MVRRSQFNRNWRTHSTDLLVSWMSPSNTHSRGYRFATADSDLRADDHRSQPTSTSIGRLYVQSSLARRWTIRVLHSLRFGRNITLQLLLELWRRGNGLRDRGKLQLNVVGQLHGDIAGHGHR